MLSALARASAFFLSLLFLSLRLRVLRDKTLPLSAALISLYLGICRCGLGTMELGMDVRENRELRTGKQPILLSFAFLCLLRSSFAWLDFCIALFCFNSIQFNSIQFMRGLAGLIRVSFFLSFFLSFVLSFVRSSPFTWRSHTLYAS